MIIGNGLIAQIFEHFNDRDDVVIFASGVSNSQETDAREYRRETELLEKARTEYPRALLVYFSSCSLSDPDRRDTRYVRHKLAIEFYLQNDGWPFIIFRLPAVIGRTNTATTLPFILYRRIISGEPIEVWRHAVRFTIDIDHVRLICSHMIDQYYRHNAVWNIALQRHSAAELVNDLAELTGRKPVAVIRDKGAPYDVDFGVARAIAQDYGLEIGNDYLKRLLRKYLPSMSNIDVSAHLPAVAGGIPARSEEDKILLNAPVIGDEEIRGVAACLRSRWIGQGPRVNKLEAQFADYKLVPYALAVNSCTSALHLSMLSLGLGAGDEVIAPTMTFVATINAIVNAGATPVLVDCDPATCNIDISAIETAITSRTRAIVVVHLYGRCCDMTPILDLARRHRLRVIEDCAHALESTWQGKFAGTIGDIGCFSFYATKSITTGEGGMLITSSEDVFQRARTLSQQGMNSDVWSRYRNQKNEYEITAPGFKYNLTDFAASLGIVQMKSLDKRWNRRRQHWHQYNSELSELPFVLPPAEEPDSRHAYHLYTVHVNQEQAGIDRDCLQEAMWRENIGTGIHYIPVHLQPYYRQRLGYSTHDLPIAAMIGQSTISLPLNTDLDRSDISLICDAIKGILDHANYNARSAVNPAFRKKN